MKKHKAGPHGHRLADQHTSHTDFADIAPRTETGLERIMFFSDAVFAIAITLLALEIRLPEQDIAPTALATALLTLMPRYFSFLLSFVVIGLFWISHHRAFEYIRTYNTGMMWINLIFLLLVAFVPFPTAVLGRFPGDLPAVLFYAAVMVGLSLVRIWFCWYVFYRARLIHLDTHPQAGRYELLRALWTASMFALSIVVAFWNISLAMALWILLIPVSMLIRPHRK
jgi:uncharacterized membrane protein